MLSGLFFWKGNFQKRYVLQKAAPGIANFWGVWVAVAGG
jgi:hypothetical protein